MAYKATPGAEIGVSVFLIAVCAAALWETRDIPPGTFEPLGSAPVPQAVASLIIVLCLVNIVRAWMHSNTTADGRPEAETAPRWVDAGAIFALTTIYAFVLQLRVLRFDVTTAIFLLLAMGLLTRFDRRRLPWVAGLSLLVGFGTQYVFTRVFVVDLPGAF